MSCDIMLGVYEKALPERLSWKEKAEAALRIGFDYIELSIDESDRRLARLDDWSGLAGLPLGSVCLSAHRRFPLGSHDPAKARRSLEIGRKAIRLAAALGIRTIQLAGYDVYYEEHDEGTEERFAEGLGLLVQEAAREGVMLGFETMETPFMDTVGKAMRYVSLIGSPYLQVYPDIGNLNNAALLYNVPLEEDLEKGAGHLAAVHVKETLPGKYRNLRFGEGRVDFSILGKCRLLGVRRYVAEMWDDGDGLWERHLAQACRTIRENVG